MIFLYARVSTSEQAADGTTSIEEQLRKGRAIAHLRNAGAFDVGCYEDRGVSGSIPLGMRPAGAEMLAAAARGDVIVAAKLDRLFRSASDALTTADRLKERGIDLILIDMGSEPVTQNGTAKLFFGMLSLVAEFERDRINERTSDGRRAKRAAGGRVGAVPYGYAAHGVGREARLIADPREQATIRRVRELAADLPPAHVLRELRREGYKTRAGKDFDFIQVKRIVARHVD